MANFRIRMIPREDIREIHFEALDELNRRRGFVKLMNITASTARLNELYTETRPLVGIRLSGKGTGASLELIKAGIWHAFENIGVHEVKIEFSFKQANADKKDRVLKRYESFGFKRQPQTDSMRLSREKYLELKSKDTYQHTLIS